jgi:hypothetical protein
MFGVMKQGSVCQAINTSRHRFEKPIHNVKDAKTVVTARYTAARAADLMILHHWICLVRPVAPAAPSVAAKLRLVARFAALAALATVQFSFAKLSPSLRIGGAYRDRTDDLMLAKQPLSQLS